MQPKTASFWTELSEKYKGELARLGIRERYDQGHVFFLEGEVADTIYLILSGHVLLKKESLSGEELVIGWKTAGQLIGDIFLLNGNEPCNVTAVARTATEVLTFKRDDFEKVLDTYPEMNKFYQKWLMKEIQIYYTKIRDLCLYGKKGALFSILVRLANMYGTETDRGIRIDLRLTHGDLARMIGGSRENVSRMLHQLMEEGVIAMEKKQMIILDLPYLKNYLRCGDCSADLCVM